MLPTAFPAAARSDYDSAAAERKADLYFLEAMRRKALGDDDLYFSLMARAAALAPDKAGRETYEHAVRAMYLASLRSDSIALERHLGRAEGYFAKNTADTYAGAYLARVYAEMGRVDRALAIYETLEAGKPNSVTLVGNHADLLMNAGRLPEAVELYRRLEKTMGRNPALTQRIANVMVLQGDTVGALTEIDGFIAAFPRSVDALQLGASAAGILGQPERALQYVERALELDPSNGVTYYYAANVYKELGREQEYEDAIRGALTGDDLERDTKLELLRYYVSEVMDKADYGEKLAPIFESLVRQYPQDYRIRQLYMSYFTSLGKFEEGAEQLRLAIDIDPSNVEDFVTLTRLYGSASDYDTAIAVAREGIERFPAEIELYQLLSGLQLYEEDFAGAEATLRKSLEVAEITDSERSELYSLLGDLAQHYDSFGDPSEFYDKALELNMANDLAMNNYAYFIATSGGDLLKARDLISKAVLYNPESATYYDTYAWVCFKLGQLEDAKRYIDLAILSEKSAFDDEDPSLAELLMHAADIYSALGQKDKAEEYRSRALAIDPDAKSE